MKKLVLNSVAFLFTVTTIVSCDYVQNIHPPQTPITTGGNTIGIDISDSTDLSTDPNLRKVLVEDYTGHKCSNCPKAAIELKNLENLYPHKIVPLAIHAGFFAEISVTYPTDFRSTTGTAYDLKFGNSAAGPPNGLINRIGYGTGSFIKQSSAWNGAIINQLATNPKFQIILKYKYNTGTLKLNTDVKVKSLTNNTGIYKIVMLLSEDSIIAEQLDKTVTPNFVPHYQFDHVLRTAINSSWGDDIFTGGASSNTIETTSKINFQLDASYKLPKCHLIAYIYDNDPFSPTYYEVLQVEEIKMK